MEISVEKLSNQTIYELAKILDIEISISGSEDVTVSANDIYEDAFCLIAKKLNLHFEINALDMNEEINNIKQLILRIVNLHFPKVDKSKLDVSELYALVEDNKKLVSVKYLKDTISKGAGSYDPGYLSLSQLKICVDEIFHELSKLK